MQYCYILKTPDSKKTYNGYTVNPYRRLRQHNQELKGGAKYTKKHGNKDWEMFILIGGYPDSQNALQCEWRIKHPDKKRHVNKRYASACGKINGLNEIFKDDQWTAFTTITNESIELTVWITEEYVDKINLIDIKPKINLIVVNKLDLETLSLLVLTNNEE